MFTVQRYIFPTEPASKVNTFPTELASENNTFPTELENKFNNFTADSVISRSLNGVAGNNPHF